MEEEVVEELSWDETEYFHSSAIKESWVATKLCDTRDLVKIRCISGITSDNNGYIYYTVSHCVYQIHQDGTEPN